LVPVNDTEDLGDAMKNDDSTPRTALECDAARRRLVSLAGLTGLGFCGSTLVWAQERRDQPQRKSQQESDHEEEVSPPEDLMREHGVLKRVLLIYGEAIRRIDAKQDVPPDKLRDAADIIKTFIEDYHEKLEEDYLFPRFERAGKHADLTKLLRTQHGAGRRITATVLQLATVQSLKNPSSAAQLRDMMRQFVRMYEPHEAREDTVLFPALRDVVSKNEFDSLGEEFEKKEHALFGEDGFEKMVNRVASIERALNIYELAQFTPKG
jgi:hemerythrin-like domain-containing protein